MSKELISASQVADFTYCARAYWLAQQGEKREISPAMKQGSAAHQELASGATEVQRAERQENLGYVIAAVLALLALLLLLLS